jgi:hypothetical protein
MARPAWVAGPVTVMVAGMATTDADAAVYIWDLALHKVVELLPDPGSQGVRAVAFSRNGRLLAAGDGDGQTYLSDVTDVGIKARLTAARQGSTVQTAQVSKPWLFSFCNVRSLSVITKMLYGYLDN